MNDRPSDPDAHQGQEPDQTLEARLERLGQIVETLEADEVELDRALSLFEEGIGHVREAERILSEAELKVEELVRQAGAAETRPLDPADE